MLRFNLGQQYQGKIEWLSNFKPQSKILYDNSLRKLKRFMDIFIIVATVPLWAPVYVMCVILIKLESPQGSVHFTQERTGKNGKRFRMYKFRTMVPNAEELKVELQHLNELKWPDFKIANDPRITHIGRFLRKTSLDELPQLFNVLQGDMTLVGPRPTSFPMETYAIWQTERLSVTPGITGLWQIIGRNKTEFHERLQLDIAYIERCCLWLDMVIIWRTITSLSTKQSVGC
jgi:lipopolysaccharide/colanic/teichoic acid biosynthesis glycosyltransferase